MINEAIFKVYPNAVTIVNNGESVLDSEGNKIEINNDLLNPEITKLQNEFDALSYQRLRLNEYPNLQDCIHALLDGGDTLTDLQAKRAEIKAKYPKPSE